METTKFLTYYLPKFTYTKRQKKFQVFFLSKIDVMATVASDFFKIVQPFMNNLQNFSTDCLDNTICSPIVRIIDRCYWLNLLV